MVDIERAKAIASQKFPYQSGAFYGNCSGLNIGVGLIYDNIPYSIFDRNEKLFDTVAGLVYILSHECDVDEDNPRFFNDDGQICPINHYIVCGRIWKWD